MGSLKPENISSYFVNHIDAERRHVTPISAPAVNGVLRVGRKCIDRFHQVSGINGVAVAGADVRSVSHNDIGLKAPYYFIQEMAQNNPNNGIEVVVGAHAYCGEIFRHGAVTRDEQKRVIDGAKQKWEEAYKQLKSAKGSPADAKRLKSFSFDIGSRGSAPLIEFTKERRKDKIKIVNQDYLNSIISDFPLEEDLIDQLVSEQVIFVKRKQTPYR